MVALLLVVTTLPAASRIDTVGAGAMTTPPAVLVGCTPKPSCVGAPAPMTTEALVAVTPEAMVAHEAFSV